MYNKIFLRKVWFFPTPQHSYSSQLLSLICGQSRTPFCPQELEQMWTWIFWSDLGGWSRAIPTADWIGLRALNPLESRHLRGKTGFPPHDASLWFGNQSFMKSPWRHVMNMMGDIDWACSTLSWPGLYHETTGFHFLVLQVQYGLRSCSSPCLIQGPRSRGDQTRAEEFK